MGKTNGIESPALKKWSNEPFECNKTMADRLWNRKEISGSYAKKAVGVLEENEMMYSNSDVPTISSRIGDFSCYICQSQCADAAVICSASCKASSCAIKCELKNRECVSKCC